MLLNQYALIVRRPTSEVATNNPHYRKAAQSGQGNPERELQTNPARQR